MAVRPYPEDWSTNRCAAETVRTSVHTVAEARDLFEMLGLVEPDGHELLPDDDHCYDDVHGTYARSGDDVSGRELPSHGTELGAATLHADGVLCLRCQAAVDRARHLAEQAAAVPAPATTRPRVSNSPTAATAAPEPAVAVKAKAPAKVTPKPTAAKPTPAKKAPAKKTGRPAKTVRRPPTPGPRCGTPGGYDDHHARGEDACVECKGAIARRQRAYEDARRARAGLPPIVPRPGGRKHPDPKPPAPEPAVPLEAPAAAEPEPVDPARVHRLACDAAMALRVLLATLDALAEATQPTTATE